MHEFYLTAHAFELSTSQYNIHAKPIAINIFLEKQRVNFEFDLGSRIEIAYLADNCQLIDQKGRLMLLDIAPDSCLTEVVINGKKEKKGI